MIKIRSRKVVYWQQNYENPVVPQGYKHICGQWNNGYVIEREKDRSQFTWVPVGLLNLNGTLDGKVFDNKFGRRNYRKEEFSISQFNEPLVQELILQDESIKKYGGFYISTFNISQDVITRRPQSVMGKKPWTNIDFFEAKEIALTFEKSSMVTSHLTYGAEYDSIIEWIIKSKVKRYYDVVDDSTNWGNYRNSINSPMKVLETGSNDKFCVNNIYDLAGNIDEWTQEDYEDSYCVIRGGHYFNFGKFYPVASRVYEDPSIKSKMTGFRIALCIK